MDEAEMQRCIIELVNALNESNLRLGAFMLTMSTLLVERGVCSEADMNTRIAESLEAVREEQRLADPAAPTASELILPA